MAPQKAIRKSLMQLLSHQSRMTWIVGDFLSYKAPNVVSAPLDIEGRRSENFCQNSQSCKTELPDPGSKRGANSSHRERFFVVPHGSGDENCVLAFLEPFCIPDG